MRNKYFNADTEYGIDFINDLEDFCIHWQVKKFCRKIHKMKLYRNVYATNPRTLIQLLKDAHGFKLKDTNPLCCEGSRKGRVYYTWKGQIHYTESFIKKLIIRIFFKHIKFY